VDKQFIIFGATTVAKYNFTSINTEARPKDDRKLQEVEGVVALRSVVPNPPWSQAE
jgi:hypothetical protein